VSPGVLYISYDGMLEPLGQSQVLAYLERLAPGRRIHLISFEKPADFGDLQRRNSIEQRMNAAAIAWHPLRYHKWPPVISALVDIVIGAVAALIISLRENVRLFHARNILCAAMAFPALVWTRGKLLADIRGFWADERVDGGLIRPAGLVYRVLKALERRVLTRADHIVTLTEASLPYLRDDDRFGRPRAPISVIPTCADLRLFRPARSSTPKRFTLGYVGQVGTWYRLDDLLAVFRTLLEHCPTADLLIVNRSQQTLISDSIRRAGLPEKATTVIAAEHSEVPQHIRRMSFGTSLIVPAFSKISSCPTKLAEYLGCGVPCLGNPGVGDVASIIERDCAGVVLQESSSRGIEAAVQRMLRLVEDPTLHQRCRQTAERYFSIEAGAERYREIYDDLLGSV
jgi:glycosyltransferase involved in cell wall biosynthesis